MSGALLRMRLFYVSYVPLFVTLMLRTLPTWHEVHHHHAKAIPALLFLTLALAGLALAWDLFRKPGGLTGTTLKVNEASDAGADAAGYLGSYVLPWIMFDETSWQVWAAFTAYMLVVMLVVTQSNLILVNPTLYLFRHKVVAIRITQMRGPGQYFDVPTLLIATKTPMPGDDVAVVAIADGYLEKTT